MRLIRLMGDSGLVCLFRCATCGQSGEVRCELCESHRRLKKYKKLTVTW